VCDEANFLKTSLDDGDCERRLHVVAWYLRRKDSNLGSLLNYWKALRRPFLLPEIQPGYLHLLLRKSSLGWIQKSYPKNDENNEDLQVHVNTGVLHLTPNCTDVPRRMETEKKKMRKKTLTVVEKEKAC